MKSQQICQLLLQTPIKEYKFEKSQAKQQGQGQKIGDQGFDLKCKLEQILSTLNEQKNQYQFTHQKQQQNLIQRINTQKDQIIEQLLKNIYNLKRQNQQLKFQYRKRFKVIKHLQDKYQNLIQGKNKKLNEMQSVIKYLQGKLKYVQKKTIKMESQIRNQNVRQEYYLFSKSPNKQYKNNKISVIVSKEKSKLRHQQRYTARNSLEDLTIPLKSSFISVSKVSSSSKTIARKKNKENYVEDPKQNDLYSSFFGSSEHFLNDKNFDLQTNFQQASRIRPICLQKSIQTSKYLTLQDLNDIEKNQVELSEPQMRRSQQLKASNSLKHQNRFIEKY